VHLFSYQKTFNKNRVKEILKRREDFPKLLVFTQVNINQIVRMIIHTLKIYCILNPFFTEMPTGRRNKKAISKQTYAPSREHGCHTDLCKSQFLFMCSTCVYSHVNTIAFTCLQNNPGECIVTYEPALLRAEDNCPSKGGRCCPRPSGAAGLCSSPVPGPCRARSLPATVQSHQLKTLIRKYGVSFLQREVQKTSPTPGR